MTTAPAKHVGSRFEDFLEADGIRDEVDARVRERVRSEQERGARPEARRASKVERD